MDRPTVGGSARRAARSWLLSLLVALALPSCGTLAYDRAWERFGAAAREDSRDDPMVGRWKGTWESEWNGHSGGLRCLMTREEEGVYLARFHSTFGWFFSLRSETRFRITGAGGGALRFEGEEDLGRLLGGVYRYAGSVEEERFASTYAAENGDHGVFLMRRVD